MVEEPSSPMVHTMLALDGVESAEEEEDPKFTSVDARHHELNVYRACAREFYETGLVKSSREGLDTRRGAVHMAVLLVVIVFCATLATGVTPLTILSLGLTDEIDKLAVRLAVQVTDRVVVQLNGLTQPAPSLCDALHLNFRYGLFSSHLEGGLESPEDQVVFIFLYASLKTVVGQGILNMYIGTEYGADLTYQIEADGSFTLYNRTSPFMLA
eukprot:EG_transcript_30004